MTAPCYSVVLETDNRGILASGTLQRVLDRLRADAEALAQPGQVLVVHDPARIPSGELWEVITASGLAAVGSQLQVDVVEAPGARYYESKNVGARRACGEIVVFLDSDTVPEPGWLGHMVEPFADPAVDVLGGSTRTGPCTDLYTKAFALFWNFPTRPGPGPIHEAPNFYANGIAVRGAVFERHPFPSDRRYRGQCATLALTLAADGITIWRSRRAITEHPPPRGFMLRRALWKGHDLFFVPERADDPRRWSVTGSLRVLGSLATGSWQRVVTGRREVGLSTRQLPAALAIAATYDLFTWLGFVVTRFRPMFLAHRFPL